MCVEHFACVERMGHRYVESSIYIISSTVSTRRCDLHIVQYPMKIVYSQNIEQQFAYMYIYRIMNSASKHA